MPPVRRQSTGTNAVPASAAATATVATLSTTTATPRTPSKAQRAAAEPSGPVSVAFHSRMVVSDDNLFEESAIQVSSASRSRTVCRDVPADLKRQLSRAFVKSEAASTAAPLDEKENCKPGSASASMPFSATEQRKAASGAAEFRRVASGTAPGPRKIALRRNRVIVTSASRDAANEAAVSATPAFNPAIAAENRTDTQNVEAAREEKGRAASPAQPDLSLIITVPAPPSLDDLELLDPELYVRIKSGVVKESEWQDTTTPFVSDVDRADIEAFLESFPLPELTRSVLPVAIIGEGTFSTVYKVIDRNFYECENDSWLEYSRQNPLDWLRLWRSVYVQETTSPGAVPESLVLIRDGRRAVHSSSTATAANRQLSSLLKEYLIEWGMKSLDSLLPRQPVTESILFSTITPRALQAAMIRFRPYFIALKRINATSSPQRILDEMSFLRKLGGQHNVIPLVNGFRGEDQVVVTFPYFHCDEFRELLGNSALLTIRTVACYMRALFQALAHLHAHGVIHRDVKPSNFLFAPESNGRAVLVDFGLAQREPPKASAVKYAQANGSVNARQVEKERKKLQAVDQVLQAMTLGKSVAGREPVQ
jgi:tRNA A-37 threonylcarbamoyl transferase component Bud32